MKKKQYSYLFIVFLLLILCQPAHSQESFDNNSETTKKFEIGGQFTILRRSDPNTAEEVFRRTGFINVKPLNQTDLGIGLRFGYNFNRNFAIESEANYFPQNKMAEVSTAPTRSIQEVGGRKFQFVAGPKIGIRRNKFGVFAKARPGFIWIERFKVISDQGEPVCVPNLGCPPSFIVSNTQSKKFFNLDVGGVFEYYPTKRTILRFDIGDTIIRYNAQEPKNINPSFTRHSLQISTGFGFRF